MSVLDQGVTKDVFKGKDYRGRDLSREDLSHKIYIDCVFDECIMHEAVLDYSKFQNCSWTNADMTDASLKHTDLEGNDLSTVSNLTNEQFCYSNLYHAKVPDAVDFSNQEITDTSAGHMWTHFVTICVLCLYSLLTISSTSDVELLNNEEAIFFPLIDMSLPTVGFYYIAPLVLFVAITTFYIHFIDFWKKVVCLPEFFPDGRSLTIVNFPLFVDIIREEASEIIKRQKNEKWERLAAEIALPGGRGLDQHVYDLRFFKYVLSVILFFFLGPITILFFWYRYLSLHDIVGSALHLAAFFISALFASVAFEFVFAALAGDKIQFGKLYRFRDISLMGLIVLVTGAISYYACYGDHKTRWHIGASHEELYTGGMEDQSDLDGYHLYESNFRHANFSGAEMQNGTMANCNIGMTSFRRANFSNVNFSKSYGESLDWEDAVLNGADFGDTYISKANLKSTQLNLTDFKRSHLAGCKFQDAQLCKSDLSRVEVEDCGYVWVKADSSIFFLSKMNKVLFNNSSMNAAVFHLAELNNVYFWNAQLKHSDFSLARCDSVCFNHANAVGSDFSNVYMSEADFSNAIFDSTKFMYASIDRAKFVEAQLAVTHFENASFREPVFTNAQLTGSAFDGAWLEKADFRGADLTDVSFVGAFLGGADLTGANITGADFTGATVTGARLPDTFDANRFKGLSQ